MNLEDSIGDILRKSRNSTQTSEADAAAAGGVTLAAYQEFERTNRAPAGLDWVTLGRRLTIGGLRLKAQHDGWLPADPDLSAWREFRMITTAGDDMTVNAYLVWDEVTREAALFDTGFDAAPIFKLIDDNQLALKHLFITHSHADHIAALETIRARFPKLRIHSSIKGAPVDQRNRPNDFIMLGSLRVTHRDTTGHAEDGVTYVVGNWGDDAPHVAIVGDAIFAGTYSNGVLRSTDKAQTRLSPAIIGCSAQPSLNSCAPAVCWLPIGC